jgi:REP element-mobilizing transposase RayT
MWRRNLLAEHYVHDRWLEFADRGLNEHGVAAGRYVLMPDHLHAFVRLHPGIRLGLWVGHAKRALGAAVRRAEGGGSVWQPGFFDHVLRSGESYAEKWAYVRENPVRAGLVERADQWPYQGEIARIEVE